MAASPARRRSSALKFDRVGTKLPLDGGEKTLEDVTIRGDEIFEPGFPRMDPRLA
jgi:hypothetical protein